MRRNRVNRLKIAITGTAIVAVLVCAAVIKSNNSQNVPLNIQTTEQGKIEASSKPEVISQFNNQYSSYKACIDAKKMEVGTFIETGSALGFSDIETNQNETSVPSFVFMIFYTEKGTRFLATHVCENTGKGISTLQKM